jgi:hypothetical protein
LISMIFTLMFNLTRLLSIQTALHSKSMDIRKRLRNGSAPNYMKNFIVSGKKHLLEKIQL